MQNTKKPCLTCNVPNLNNGACCLDETNCQDIAAWEIRQQIRELADIVRTHDKTITAWAILDPRGKIIDYTIRPSKEASENAFTKENPDFLSEWGFGAGSKHLRAKVRVTIEKVIDE